MHAAPHAASADDLLWEPPGPGSWGWEGSHFPGAPTPIYAGVMRGAMVEGVGTTFERYGVPLRTIRPALVNGKLYSRIEPLVGANKPATKTPPAAALWLVTRLHPEFRRRTKTAARAIRDRIWRARVSEWSSTIKPRQHAANLALQDEDISALDDAALADHVRRAHDHCLRSVTLHFDLHGDDLGALGDYLATCEPWGITAAEAITVLDGASPSSRAPQVPLAAVASAVRAAGVMPETLADVRGASPEAEAAFDAYLREYGWRLVTGYDICDHTLVELPEALLLSIQHALSTGSEPPPERDADAARAALRERVPADDRATFDALVDEARITNDLRDDNGPMTVAWPGGLLRRALLETGRRLVARGQLDDAEHAVELELDEIVALLEGASEPTAAAVGARALRRAALVPMRPPPQLGPVEPEPSLDLMPAPLARVARMAQAALGTMEAPADRRSLRGTGIGTRPYVGQARVGHRPEELLRSIEPGDIIVVPFTTPAFNAVLAVAGALVTEEGGPLCHAAVMARELDIPGVVGAAGVLDAIPDGARIEVDPREGTVRVLDA